MELRIKQGFPKSHFRSLFPDADAREHVIGADAVQADA